MSEFQYHEWQTVDRLLTLDEQARVNRLSSHMDVVTASQAVVTYQWGDFKHDPRQVLLDSFDAYFYYANWGSRRLMFRFPKGLLDPATIEPYCDGESVSFVTSGAYQVLDLDFNPEDGGWDEDVDGELSGLIALRADLIEGDYRLLYLAWLNAMDQSGAGYEVEGEYDEEYEEYDEESEGEGEDSQEDVLEPPVPPGLKKLTPALDRFAGAFGLDPFLIQAAAEASPDRAETPAIDYRALIARLPRPECDEFLLRLANGEGGVRLALRKRLAEFLPPANAPAAPAQPRSFRQLLERAEQLSAAEEKHRAEKARKKYIADMQALAQQAPALWRQVDELLDRGPKSAATYDQATAILERLKNLAEYQNTPGAFSVRIQDLAARYASRPALMSRWREKNWV